jgi:CRISPR/Cas system-associated endoribonuclease Cas2
MNVYLVSYDLDQPGPQNYDRLIARLEKLGAIRVLYSQWLLRFRANAAALEQDLMQYIDPATDTFLVTALTRDTAWNKLRISDADFRVWLKG